MATTTISEARICSMALSHLGEDAIESLTEGTAESNACDLWYDYSRRIALASHDFGFARTRQALATHDDDPPSGIWGYRYQYPSDCVKLRKLQSPSGDQADNIPYEIELGDNRDNKSIVTDLQDAVAVFTYNLTQVDLFTEYFILMLSFGLAGNLTYSITGKREFRKDMIATAQSMALMAPANDANEQQKTTPRDADWHRAR